MSFKLAFVYFQDGCGIGGRNMDLIQDINLLTDNRREEVLAAHPLRERGGPRPIARRAAVAATRASDEGPRGSEGRKDLRTHGYYIRGGLV